jgi:hypothetical protein
MRYPTRSIYSRTSPLLFVAAFTCVATLSLASPRTLSHQAGPAQRFTDKSDWWSFYSSDLPPELFAAEERAVNLPSATVRGIALNQPWSNEPDSTFGKAIWVQRGEASTKREQACYVSAADGAPTYLVFESGVESNASFYLFRGGPTWTGNDLCVRSTAVTESLPTASGIHLGQDIEGVVAILGVPNQRTPTQLLYALHQRVKLSENELDAIRREKPTITEDELKKLATEHPTYELLEVLVARFDDNGLKYFGATVMIGD